ncbi:Granule-bound starch synthase 1 [Hibiscus syriacus]|uniref:Granule-bound starch synthase 1 n=1 Tax=Hibiscus syriacus TaxID=106335 RepID=A0A6A2WHQ9_HIBSY|nr:Granule-bound starch synthase 1 [Hibiscus syriacus]
MATVAASRFVSTTSHGAETKANLGQIGWSNQPMIHNALRSVNKLDRLQMRTNAKAAVKEAHPTANHKLNGKIVCGTGMNIVFVGAEVGPWSKTGGFGDVLGGLPPEMAAKEHRVMTVSPRYDQYKDAWDTCVSVELKVGDTTVTVRFFHCYKRGVDRFFVDHPMFLEKVWGKTGSKIYGPKAGTDYKDNQLRFSLLCLAALEAPRVLNLNSNKYFLGPYEKPVKGRKINLMKAGILESDRVLTVSPYYVQELVSGEDKGVELDVIIRKPGITGIVNGMDVQKWNPSTDKYISVKYDATTVSNGCKGIIKGSSSSRGLPVDKYIPLIAFIGRLEEQKGSDILVAALPKFIGENCQIVVLGTGKKATDKQLEQLEILYPGKAKFNVPLAHMIFASADYLLVPSRFEPCGLIQLQAMQYGNLPIVASTGGLVDTVKEGFTGFHMGAFNVECDTVDPSDVDKVVKGVKRALAVYGTGASREMIQNCMAQDLSWGPFLYYSRLFIYSEGPSKLWEKMLLSLEVAGSEPGIEGEEIVPLAKENIATS